MFNDQQLEAINSNERTILCLAGAGAGKSTVMVNRIKRLVDDGLAKPWEILALTFTNAAAFEMGEKYKKILTGPTNKIPEFRTFHGFCYSLLIKDPAVRERMGYTKVPQVCDDKTVKKIREEVKMQLKCSLSDAKLDGTVPKSSLTLKERQELDLFKKAVKKRMRTDNLITFDIMCYTVCEMFEKDEDCIKKYKEKYKYIHVDEFQDTDKRQFKFLSSFPSTCSFFLVGDALQMLYAFRGCTNEYIKMLSASPDWKIIKMYKNYRSTRQICQFANNMSGYAKPEYRIEMEGQRDGEPVEVIRGSHVSFNNPVDMDHLSILMNRLRASETESAVLCRTNKEVTKICDELKAAGIQYSTSNKSTDVLDILNSSLDNSYMMEWLSTFLDGVEYGDYVRLASQQEIPDIRWFLNTYGRHSKIKEAGKKIIEIRTIVQQADLTVQEKFNNITKLLRIKSRCEFDRSIQYTNKQLIESIRDQIEEQEDNKLYVGTIHSSKGLEYDTVYLMGVDDGMFELGTEDMNNLYYVGITRAKNHLTVFRY